VHKERRSNVSLAGGKGGGAGNDLTGDIEVAGGDEWGCSWVAGRGETGWPHGVFLVSVRLSKNCNNQRNQVRLYVLLFLFLMLRGYHQRYIIRTDINVDRRW